MISSQIPRVKNYMKCLVDSIERSSWTLLPVAVHFTIGTLSSQDGNAKEDFD